MSGRFDRFYPWNTLCVCGNKKCEWGSSIEHLVHSAQTRPRDWTWSCILMLPSCSDSCPDGWRCTLGYTGKHPYLDRSSIQSKFQLSRPNGINRRFELKITISIAANWCRLTTVWRTNSAWGADHTCSATKVTSAVGSSAFQRTHIWAKLNLPTIIIGLRQQTWQISEKPNTFFFFLL